MDLRIEAPELFRRYQQSDAFRRYVDERLPLIAPIALFYLVFSLSTTAAAVVTLGGTHSFLVLLMLVAAPFLLLGTLSVLLFVFFSWLEGRAIAQSLSRMRKGRAPRPALSWSSLGAALGAVPRVSPLVWGLLAALVGLPLLLLARLSLPAALLMLLLALAAPVAYVHLDR